MNSTPISRFVIGVALLGVFGVVTYEYAVRAAHQAKVAQLQPAAPIAPPAAVPATAPPDATASAPVAATPPAPTAPVPTPSVAQNDTAAPAAADTATSTTGDTPSKSKRHRTRHSDDSGSADTSTSVAANHAAPPPAAPVTAAPAPEAAAAPAAAALATADATAAPPDAGASDSKISADVKSQIASAAPSANVNVTTTDGTVALTGSVPSQDAVNQAKQAALSVPGVKTVDTSGLLVNNQ